MEQTRAVTSAITAAPRPRPPASAAVGASYTFDPGADGLASVYALRALERGVDPRALCAEARAERGGERGIARLEPAFMPVVARFGRGTRFHQRAASRANPASPPATATPDPIFTPAPSRRPDASRWTRRLAAAGLVALLALPLGAHVAGAQEAIGQSRYIVQEGDTLESVAAEFGVDPAAILAASAVQNAPWLTPDEIIIIPSPAESPDEAFWNAAQRVGSSPFVVGAHRVSDGETLANISWNYGLDPWALAAFNGLSDLDALSSGELLRIPLTDRVAVPEETWVASEPLADIGWSETPSDVGGMAPAWEEPAAAPMIAVDAPAYQQMYSLSCEYAAAFIATSALGYGVPESAFLERVGLSANPHWGYRGDIHGAWGGADDYGIYPEAMAPTLQEFGYATDIFYSGGDASALTARLDAGMPVITWLGYFGDTAWVQEDEGSYLLAPGMHVVVVYGYDDNGVYVSNPGRGNYDYYAWSDFLAMWQILDGMAMGIAPM